MPIVFRWTKFFEIENHKEFRGSMICPKCESEYREGFYRCADCDLDLVRDLETTAEESPTELVRVLETKDSSFLGELVIRIEDQSIPYLVQSGTAFSEEVILEKDHPVWRGVLFVPERFVEKIGSLMIELKVEAARDSEQHKLEDE